MEPLTLHYTFQLHQHMLQDDRTWNKLLAVPDLCLGEETSPTILDCGENDKLIVASATNGSHVLMHMYDHGLVTIDVQRFLSNTSKDRDENALLPLEFKHIKRLEMKIRTRLGDTLEFSRSIPMPIRRGKVCPYFVSGNECLKEMEGLTIVCEKETVWQNIKIYQTANFGNMLCLDDEIMLSDADLIYTHTLMGLDRNDYSDRTVLILGGGDGGLLHELLKQNPKHVLMVEIDEGVIRACRDHMRGVCGNSMDEIEGDRYLIRIDNCVDVLKECAEQERKFDYIINDLTEHLCGTETEYAYDFKTTAWLLETSFKVLNNRGKYLSRGCCQSMTDEIEAFESDITALGLKSTKFTVEVPSYREKYCLFEIVRTNDETNA